MRHEDHLMGLFGSLLARIAGSGQSAASTAPPLAINPATITPEERQKRLDALSVRGQDESASYMEWQTVTSSWITGLRFNPLVPLAQMCTKSGKVYSFGGMPFDVFRKWLLSSSKGKFFNDHLLGRYTQWQEFVSVGKGVKAEESRAFGTTVLKELGIR